MRKRSQKKGFSLAEALVSVAIIAIVAAVVVPSIGSQLNKGDITRLTNDMVNIRAGVEQFLADVRRYPASVDQLITAVTTSDNAFDGTVYVSSQVNRWKGPYLSKNSAAIALTGFGATIVTTFRNCIITNAANSCMNQTGQKYLTIVMTGLSQTEAARADSTLDDGNVTTGMFQWVAKGAGVADTTRFYALPIQ